MKSPPRPKQINSTRFSRDNPPQSAITGHSPSTRAKIAAGVHAAHVEKELLKEIRRWLLEPKDKRSVNPAYIEFLNKFRDAALKDVNSFAGRKMGDLLLRDDTIQLLDKQLDSLQSKDEDFARYRVIKHFFRKQQEVLYDTTSRRVFLMCGRRAGKTHLLAGMILLYALERGTPMIYVHRNLTNAVSQLWAPLMDLCARVDFEPSSSSKAAGRIEWPNGSTLQLRGNSSNDEADSSRGYKYRLAIIDEGCYQRNMGYLIDSVLTPAGADFPDSRLVVSSTPPRTRNYFWESVKEAKSGWTHYRWNFHDNPYISNPDDVIAEICASKGISPDHTLIQREYEGLEVYDREAQVYKTRHFFETLPPVTHVAGGIDFGTVDATAIVLVAYNKTEPKDGYVIYERKFRNPTTSLIADEVKRAYEYARSIPGTTFYSFYADTSDTITINEMRLNYNLPILAAMKSDKVGRIARLRDLLATGRLKVHSSLTLLEDEFEQTVWKRADDDSILEEIDDAAFHPDLCDALHYSLTQIMWDWGDLFEKSPVIAEDPLAATRPPPRPLARHKRGEY